MPTFTVRFAPNSGGVFNATLHIANNDSDEAPFDIALRGTGRVPDRGILAFANAEVYVNESAVTLLVPISRSGGSEGPVSVRVDSTNGPATSPADFSALNNAVVNFAEGETSKNIGVTILADALNEANETFTLTLGSPSGGALLGAQTTATVRIIDSFDSSSPPVPP